MGLTLEALDERLTAIEARLAVGATAQADSAEHTSPLAHDVHPSTLRAMQRHAPPLTQEERTTWLGRIIPGRRFKVAGLVKLFFKNRPDGKAGANRVCFWLKREGYLLFDESKFQYYRPAGNSEHMG